MEEALAVSVVRGFVTRHKKIRKKIVGVYKIRGHGLGLA